MSAERSATRSRARPDAAAVLTRAVRRAADLLELRQGELAAILGLSPASVSRLARGRAIAPASKEGELALLFLRVFRSLDTLVGGDAAKARAWLRADHRHLGRPPLERIKTIEGLVDVADLLDALRGKV
jgi:hypothetical protein